MKIVHKVGLYMVLSLSPVTRHSAQSAAHTTNPHTLLTTKINVYRVIEQLLTLNINPRHPQITAVVRLIQSDCSRYN